MGRRAAAVFDQVPEPHGDRKDRAAPELQPECSSAGRIHPPINNRGVFIWEQMKKVQGDTILSF